MGMAASQARFLGLTARKNNVEYEGQQINQQRTALANQSANYYNDMLGMSVPVPPSIDNYTKTVYTFEDGALTNEITAMIAKGNGDYTVSYLRQWTDDFSVVNASTSIINKSGSTYMIGNDTLRQLGSTSGYSTSTDEYLKDLSSDELNNLMKEENDYIALLNDKYGNDTYYVRYVKNSTTEEWEPYFYKGKDFKAQGDGGNAIYDSSTGNSQSSISCYKIGSETKIDEVKAVAGCKVEKDSSGRYINIAIPIYDESGNKTNQFTKYALTTSTIADQAAYDDAMNQYEYEKAEYDQAINDINAKIEIIQAQDKNLELRLKQLDTEQEAISTELEAVSGVIEKNTQSSFKTFG